MEKELIAECSDFLEKCNVNVFKLQEWKKLVNGDDFSEVEYDKLIEYFIVDTMQPDNSLASTKDNLNLKSCVEEEIYKVLSSEKNRGKAQILTTALISAISANIANALNINEFITTGIANLILLGIIKVGVDAWCHYYEKKNM